MWNFGVLKNHLIRWIAATCPPIYDGWFLTERYGYKINDRINYLRVELAKKLIRKNYLDISEISNMCGFSHRTYFYNVFKKIEGISPAQYKNEVLPYSGS